MSSDLKLVIFDCDGTLVDSQQVIISAMRMAFHQCGLMAPEDQSIRAIIGLSLLEAVGTLAPTGASEQIELLVEAYKAAFIHQRQGPDFYEPLFAGAREILDQLSQLDNVLLGVATGKSRRGVEALFERERLGDYFVAIQTADDAPSKPHPGMIENALALTGVQRRNALMIGDTSFDMLMARNAKVGAIGVSWGNHPETTLVSAGAHRVIENFEEIYDVVDQISQLQITEESL